jgi:hypothetical protein
MRSVIAFVLVALLACGSSSQPATTTTPTPPTETTSAASKTLVNVDANGVGLGGYDPVAYGAYDAPMAGLGEYAAEHGGAKYRFASAAHKATFDGDPSKHVPAYGGFCAFAASENRLSEADPTVFQIVDGQLLVFTSLDYKQQFNKDTAGNKAKADRYWPGLVAAHGQ